MTKQTNRWGFIINPIAGNGDSLKVTEQLKSKIASQGIDAGLFYTERTGHAGEIASKLADEGYSHIIGVGGDGTFNEIASSLVSRENITTGLIPAGTGNDFIQILGYPDRFGDAEWDSFFRLETIRMDAGRCNEMIFMNGMGLGFDAQVAAENYTAPGEIKRGGKNKYVWHILKTLLFYREGKMETNSNGEKSVTDCFMNTVAIGRRFAGGFYLTPSAIANDGLLDVCSIKRLSLPQRLRILMMVPKGTHVNDKRINYYKVSELKLHFPEKVPFHVDGELYFAQDFDISLMPDAVSVIYNQSGPHYFNTTGTINPNSSDESTR